MQAIERVRERLQGEEAENLFWMSKNNKHCFSVFMISITELWQDESMRLQLDLKSYCCDSS
jgi:hypothetical protein